MKQVQFAHYKIAADAVSNQNIRAEIEGVLNNGWELESWQPVGYTVNEDNQPSVGIMVCLVREVDNPTAVADVAVKRGRPKKDA